MKNNNWYPWVVVGLLWVVALLNYMDRQMLSTMQEAMKIDISELNKAEAFGALMAVFFMDLRLYEPHFGDDRRSSEQKMADIRKLVCLVNSHLSNGICRQFSGAILVKSFNGNKRGSLHSISVIAYRRLASRKIQIIGHRHTHDGIICRTGSRWFRSYNRSNIFMAFHFSLVRNHRYRLLSDSHVRIKRKSGS